MQIRKAAKTATKLRLLVAGVPGSGKTYSALRIGSELAKLAGHRLGLIDTEHASSGLYADEANPDGGVFDFDAIDLSEPDETGTVSYSVERYTKALHAFAAAGYPVLVVDSISHAWNGPGGILEIVDRIGKGMSGWKAATPAHQRFIEALLGYPGHLILTSRTKIEWDLSDTKKPQKVGTALVQREGVEYEVSLVLEMDTRHNAQITKSRIGSLQDRYVEKPGAELARLLHGWATAAERVPTPAELLAEAGLDAAEGWRVEELDAWCAAEGWAAFSARPLDAQRAFVQRLRGGKGREMFLGWLARQGTDTEGARMAEPTPPDAAEDGAEGSTPSPSTTPEQKPARRKGRAA